MTVSRRALAVLPLGALALAAPAVQAAEIRTLPCVSYARDAETKLPIASMPVIGAGFTPGGFVRVSTTTPTSPAPLGFTSAQADASGAFGKLVAPPSIAGSNQRSFTLIATDTTNPSVPIQTAPFRFEVVRFGTTSAPEPRLPSTRVRYTARGFTPDRPIYMHFRFAGQTRRTVSLGVASSPCGIASRRMRALPTRSRFGTWTTYTSQAKRFSRSTDPMWVSEFTVYRRFS